jgi:hypothetical protein
MLPHATHCYHLLYFRLPCLHHATPCYSLLPSSVLSSTVSAPCYSMLPIATIFCTFVYRVYTMLLHAILCYFPLNPLFKGFTMLLHAIRWYSCIESFSHVYVQKSSQIVIFCLNLSFFNCFNYVRLNAINCFQIELVSFYYHIFNIVGNINPKKTSFQLQNSHNLT